MIYNLCNIFCGVKKSDLNDCYSYALYMFCFYILNCFLYFLSMIHFYFDYFSFLLAPLLSFPALARYFLTIFYFQYPINLVLLHLISLDNAFQRIDAGVFLKIA